MLPASRTDGSGDRSCSVYHASLPPRFKISAGDFADAATSPNDPVFFFHHANLDRLLTAWQLRHARVDPATDFPFKGHCPGHGRHDVVNSAWPFHSLGLASKSLEDDEAPYKNSLLMQSLGRAYTYDDLSLSSI